MIVNINKFKNNEIFLYRLLKTESQHIGSVRLRSADIQRHVAVAEALKIYESN